jgi:hypothetical protein
MNNMRKLRTSFAYNISQPEESTRIHPSETELVNDLRASGLDLYSIKVDTYNRKPSSKSNSD